MSNNLNQKAEEFRKHKQALSPVLKLEANIPQKILKVISIDESIETGQQDGKQYAQLTFIVEVETSEGVMRKDWNVTSEGLVTILESNAIDVGSSFTVTKKGEGFHTKYLVTDVVNQ